MAAGSNVAPVIIKKKKIVGGDGHHGGAWKVAYADFVTAMMAFFMLMWLLNATTEKQRKGLADYFSPSVQASRMSSGSDGMFMGDSVFSEDVLPRDGRGATLANPTLENKASGGLNKGEESEKEDDPALKKIDKMLQGLSGESMVADFFKEHIVTRVTDEGLIVEIFDTSAAALFDNRNQPSERLEAIAAAIVDASAGTSNAVAIEGYVASYPVVQKDNPAWENSSARAFELRNLLEKAGFYENRTDRVTAHGDQEPWGKNPMSVRNNRLKVIFLRD